MVNFRYSIGIYVYCTTTIDRESKGCVINQNYEKSWISLRQIIRQIHLLTFHLSGVCNTKDTINAMHSENSPFYCTASSPSRKNWNL